MSEEQQEDHSSPRPWTLTRDGDGLNHILDAKGEPVTRIASIFRFAVEDDANAALIVVAVNAAAAAQAETPAAGEEADIDRQVHAGETVMSLFRDLTGNQATLADMLTALRHHAARDGLDFDVAVETADERFRNQTAPAHDRA